MAFHDVRLPDDIERGATGGPRFKTTVFQLDSGKEKRNIDWSVARGEWDIGYGLLEKFSKVGGLIDTDLDIITNFFYARQGRANSFRFKDWGDFDIGDQADPLVSSQTIGTGDAAETSFQIFKQYLSGAITYNRTITKIVSGTLFVYVDGILQADPGDYSVGLNTGIILFVSAPAASANIAVTTQFDNHARFDTDHLQMSMEIFNAGAVPSLPVVELLGTGL